MKALVSVVLVLVMAGCSFYQHDYSAEKKLLAERTKSALSSENEGVVESALLHIMINCLRAEERCFTKDILPQLENLAENGVNNNIRKKAVAAIKLLNCDDPVLLNEIRCGFYDSDKLYEVIAGITDMEIFPAKRLAESK